MAIQSIAGFGSMIPEIPERWFSGSYVFTFGNLTIDAEGEKIGYCGRVWNKDGASKNISKVHFRFGSAITKAGGSTVRVSLQDLSTTARDPDGTADQSYTIANADANFAANTWYSATLDAARTVACGEEVSVVWEFNGSFVAGDSVTISGITAGGTPSYLGQCYADLYASGVWAVQLTVHPNLVLEFDDGTFGTLLGAGIFSNIGTLSVASNTNPDEVAVVFQLPFPVKASALWAYFDCDGDSTVNLIYGGSTASVSISRYHRPTIAAAPFLIPLPAWVDLAKDTDYYVSILPVSTTAITVSYADVASANYWQAYDGGPNFRFTSRVDGGAWSAATATRRILAGIGIIGGDDAVSVGGGIWMPRARQIGL